MANYDFPVPRPRGYQTLSNDECDIVVNGQEVCASDLVLHILLGRVTTTDGTTTEIETVFNPSINAVDIDIPSSVLQSIETVGIGPNLQRYMLWLAGNVDDQTAADVEYDNTTSGLDGENVQDAIDELSSISGTYQVKATSLDPTPGFLTDKVDNTTIQIFGNELRLIDGGHDHSHQDLLNLQGGSATERQHLTTAQHTNLTSGTPEFDSVTIDNAPSTGSDAATKDYVDAVAAGASSWLEAVDDFFDPTGGLPDIVAPTTLAAGDRYIATSTANGWTANNVYEYATGWSETMVVSGNATYVTAEGIAYINSVY